MTLQRDAHAHVSSSVALQSHLYCAYTHKSNLCVTKLRVNERKRFSRTYTRYRALELRACGQSLSRISSFIGCSATCPDIALGNLRISQFMKHARTDTWNRMDAFVNVLAAAKQRDFRAKQIHKSGWSVREVRVSKVPMTRSVPRLQRQ